MANISNLIKNIRQAVFGKDVRESIASAIEQTYEDAAERGNANMEVVDARGYYDTLKKRLDGENSNLKEQLIDIRQDVAQISTGTPIFVDSTSQMTNTSKLYVLSTNGEPNENEIYIWDKLLRTSVYQSAINLFPKNFQFCRRY